MGHVHKPSGASFTVEVGDQTKEYDAIDLAIKLEGIDFDSGNMGQMVEKIKQAFDMDLTASQAIDAANGFIEFMEDMKKKWPWMQSFGASTESEETPEPEEAAKNAEEVQS